MRVVCIKKCEFLDFTIQPGDWIEVYQESFHETRTNGNFGTYTFERNGSEWLCKRDHFMTVSEWREQQLNKLNETR